MNIAVGSAFRNSPPVQVNRFLNQVAALKAHAGPNHYVRTILVEGDSTDDTRHRLSAAARKRDLDFSLLSCDHGGPMFGSTEDPNRMTALSKVGNVILDGVQEEDDVLVYVESDLIWDSHSIGSLIDIAYERREGVDVVAPLPFAGPHFYDIWAFRKDGDRFSPFAPYHERLASVGITRVDSAGSCLVMRADVARHVRMTDGALVEWCNNARGLGYIIGVHANFWVHHP